MAAMRTRWAALGAAVAVSLGAGGIGLSQAALSSGPKPVFVAITPCRLVDTRPGAPNIGPRDTPLGANETLTVKITGPTVGQCTDIPPDAVAAALNVTAIQPTAQSFLTVYPADSAAPNASNLNWAAGDPPTPNKVDVRLGSTGTNQGKIKLTNSVGTVHVAADLVGYYIDHSHDDITGDVGIVAYAETINSIEVAGRAGEWLTGVSITAPQASGGGYVLINSTTNAYTTTPADCPCGMSTMLAVGEEDVGLPSFVTLGSQPNEVGEVTAAVSNMAVVSIAAGETLNIWTGTFNIDTSPLNMHATLSAVFVPTKSASSFIP